MQNKFIYTKNKKAVTYYKQLPLSFIQGRTAQVNHLKENRLADYIGQLNLIMFAPEDLELIKGAPSIRRRFLDMEIGQIRPVYLHNSVRYNRALKERNAYLKVERKQIDSTFLDVLDSQLAEHGQKISAERHSFISKLENLAQKIHHQLTHGLEELKINYKISSESLLDDLEKARL